MSAYKRYRKPGGTYFFTVNLLDRRIDTLTRHVDALRAAVLATRRERPFHIDAWVVLPDHMHCVWTLPAGDHDFSNRWKAIKTRFVKAIPFTERRSRYQIAKGERGIWQRRFWEHLIHDENDFIRHVDYVHWNPMKHGLVTTLAEWPYSTFHRYVQRGIYPSNWAGGNEFEVKTGEF